MGMGYGIRAARLDTPGYRIVPFDICDVYLGEKNPLT
jgi:hypothetical protein